MANFLSEGLGGAATGAGIGSAIAPGIGTAIGGIGGGLLGLLSGLFGPKPEKPQALHPGQQKLQDESIRQALSLLQGGQPQNFAPIEQQAQRQFQTETVPSLAERFSSLGAQNSSAFQGALGNAGANLQSQLASLRAQYGQNQLAQLLNPALSSLDVTRQGPGPFENAGSGALSILPLLLAMQNRGQQQNPIGTGQPIQPGINNPPSQPSSTFQGLFNNLGVTNPTQQFGFPGSNYLGNSGGDITKTFGFPGYNFLGQQGHLLGGNV